MVIRLKEFISDGAQDNKRLRNSNKSRETAAGRCLKGNVFRGYGGYIGP